MLVLLSKGGPEVQRTHFGRVFRIEGGVDETHDDALRDPDVVEAHVELEIEGDAFDRPVEGISFGDQGVCTCPEMNGLGRQSETVTERIKPVQQEERFTTVFTLQKDVFEEG